MDIRPEGFAQSLRFVLFLGAAFHDLGVWKMESERKQLSRRVEALLPAFRVNGDEGPIRDCIQRMMDKVNTERFNELLYPDVRTPGKVHQWEPTGEYGRFLNRLK